jgi:acyl-coenzyme A thioesterase PaaI-like protein
MVRLGASAARHARARPARAWPARARPARLPLAASLTGGSGTRRARSSPSSAPRPPWVSALAASLPPRFADAPSRYWEGGALGAGGSQVHGPDTVLALLHDAGAFADPALLVDAARREVLLTLRTGARVAGHPGWTHGGFTGLLLDEMAGQAYCEFVQPARGPGVTANLNVDYARPLPTAMDLLVAARIASVEDRKVRVRVVVADGPDVNDAERTVFAEATALFVVLDKASEDGR